MCLLMFFKNVLSIGTQHASRRKGNALHKSGDYNGAIMAYTQALRLDQVCAHDHHTAS